jgi:hypothetical protein
MLVAISLKPTEGKLGTSPAILRDLPPQPAFLMEITDSAGVEKSDGDTHSNKVHDTPEMARALLY